MNKLNTKLLSYLLIIFLLIPNLASANFKDVGTTHQYQEAINSLASNNCIQGYEDKTFKPENKITRAETLKLILNCLDIPKIYTEEVFSVPAGSSYILNSQEIQITQDSEIKIKVPFNPKTYPSLEFRDIDNTEWFIDTLKEALVRKIITGYADNTIKATRTVAKGEFFSMLYRVVPKELQKADLSKDLSNDALIGQWYTEALAFAVQNQIIGIDSEGNINPFRELNRGQVAHFIYIYKKWINNKLAGTPTPTPETTNEVAVTDTTAPVSPTPVLITPTATDYQASGTASFMGKGIAGSNTASGEAYNPDHLTAAHPTLPFGTIVTVTDPISTKFVRVKIIDRGPNQTVHPDRVIDLSYAAFEALTDISKGVLNVDLKIETEFQPK
jgi:rare lipoprotein A